MKHGIALTVLLTSLAPGASPARAADVDREKVEKALQLPRAEPALYRSLLQCRRSLTGRAAELPLSKSNFESNLGSSLMTSLTTLNGRKGLVVYSDDGGAFYPLPPLSGTGYQVLSLRPKFGPQLYVLHGTESGSEAAVPFPEERANPEAIKKAILVQERIELPLATLNVLLKDDVATGLSGMERSFNRVGLEFEETLNTVTALTTLGTITQEDGLRILDEKTGDIVDQHRERAQGILSCLQLTDPKLGRTVVKLSEKFGVIFDRDLPVIPQASEFFAKPGPAEPQTFDETLEFVPQLPQGLKAM